jgi:CcmD family protein
MDFVKYLGISLVYIVFQTTSVFATKGGGEYEAFKPGMSQNVNVPLFVVIAYSVIWIVLLGLLVALWRRQGRLNAELEQLEAQLKEQR